MRFKIDIPQNANVIIHTLKNNGYTAYIVGGCVRDSIMGRKPHDWDICTSATPDQLLEIFMNYKVIETGLKHGTITIVIDGEQYECTTYRIDGEYSDNRRPDNVTFTNDLIEDLKRRDFTINAMAYNDEEGLIDPFNGVLDISRKLICCVGTPEERFNEDALRIMRAIRFAAQLDFHIDQYTHIAMIELSDNLKNISAERINSELCKTITSKNPAYWISNSRYILGKVIPEIEDMIGFKQRNPYHQHNVFNHTIQAIWNCTSTDLIARLAVLFHDIGKPHCYQDGEDGIRYFKGHNRVSADMTDKIMKRLKFDNETRNNVVELVYYHDATFEADKKYVKHWLNKIGVDQFRKLLDIRRADIKGQKFHYDKERIEKVDNIERLLEEVLQEKQCFALKDLAINGKDLMEIGFKAGKELGEALNRLLEGVINEEFENEKDYLLKVAKARL